MDIKSKFSISYFCTYITLEYNEYIEQVVIGDKEYIEYILSSYITLEYIEHIEQEGVKTGDKHTQFLINMNSNIKLRIDSCS